MSDAKACPVCGNENWDGRHCMNCGEGRGYEPPSGWNRPACCSEQDPTAPWNQPDAYTCCDCDQYDGTTRDCGFCRFRYARLVEEAGGRAPAPRGVSGCVVPWDQCACGGFSEVQ